MKRMLWWFAIVAVAACGDNTGPGGVPDAQLNVILQDSLSPPLFAVRDSFWAKVEDGREMKLYYQGATPSDSGEEFLRIEVPGDGLYRKPDGTPFQVGDSILITVTVVDPARFLFAFEPSGLQFNPEHPARLRVRYLNSEKDFNEDGVEDSSDVRIEGELDMWHRSSPGALWFRLGSVKFEDLDEIDANIRTFSQFAVAW